MPSGFYNSFKRNLMNASFDLDTDTIKVALVTASYTPDFDTHVNFSDVTDEVVGTGYSAGGATLSSPSLSQDNTGDKGIFDAADTSWPSATITARGAVIYKSTGVASTSGLIAYIDFGSNISSSGGTFLITWNSAGIINVT